MKQVIISNKKLAQIIHMELIGQGIVDWQTADEVFEHLNDEKGFIRIRESNDVKIEEVQK